MAASQVPAAPSAASGSVAIDGPVPAAGTSGGTPAASSSHPSSKLGTPQPAAPPPVPHRDKEGLQRVLLERFMTHDWLHSAGIKEGQQKLEEDTRRALRRVGEYKSLTAPDSRSRPHPSLLYGPGYSGFGNGYTESGGGAKIVYPSQRPRPGRRSTPALKFTRKNMKKQAEQHEELVPVRVDVDWDKVKLRDTFTYNLHERLIPIELFAAQMVEDMGLKPPMDKHVHEQVVQQIHEQLCDFYPFAYSEEDPLDPELPYSAYKNDEMRILVKLNITIGAHTLVDQFEWEINNPMNSPEEFASSMARDLSLSGEFTTAIAHCIREQAQLFTRSLYSIGHPFDGRPIEDPDLTNAFLPSPLPSVFRPQQQAKDFAPYLYENTEAELERSETMFSREQRRQKRSVNRRGGPQLPDLKERQRTIRTSIVSSVLPGAALDIEETRLFKRTTGVGTLTGRGKRAARDGDLSDSEDSEDSAPDSPAMSQLQGTARTRGMRGAASAAAQRMANIGRSETPELIVHHHETRTSRRFGRETTREETEEPTRHIVTLKVSPGRLRKLLRDLNTRQSIPATPSGAGTPSGQNHQRAPSASVPGSMGPPSTPSASNQKLPSKSATPSLQSQLGAIPAPPPPSDGRPPPPPPPDWLVACLADLNKLYPDDAFEGTMRYCAIDPRTEQQLVATADKPFPADAQFMYLPRIRCRDCTGKLYTPGPEMTADNFKVHLKNLNHRKKVTLRLAGGEGRANNSRPSPGSGGVAVNSAGAAQRMTTTVTLSSSTLPALSVATPAAARSPVGPTPPTTSAS